MSNSITITHPVTAAALIQPGLQVFQNSLVPNYLRIFVNETDVSNDVISFLGSTKTLSEYFKDVHSVSCYIYGSVTGYNDSILTPVVVFTNRNTGAINIRFEFIRRPVGSFNDLSGTLLYTAGDETPPSVVSEFSTNSTFSTNHDARFNEFFVEFTLDGYVVDANDVGLLDFNDVPATFMLGFAKDSLSIDEFLEVIVETTDHYVMDPASYPITAKLTPPQKLITFFSFRDNRLKVGELVTPDGSNYGLFSNFIVSEDPTDLGVPYTPGGMPNPLISIVSDVQAVQLLNPAVPFEQKYGAVGLQPSEVVPFGPMYISDYRRGMKAKVTIRRMNGQSLVGVFVDEGFTYNNVTYPPNGTLTVIGDTATFLLNNDTPFRDPV